MNRATEDKDDPMQPRAASCIQQK